MALPAGARAAVSAVPALLIGEALGLQWADVDMDAGTLTVNRTIGPLKKAGLITGPPKSRNPRRTIKLPTVVMAALKRHRVRQKELRLKAGETWLDAGWVFTTPFGIPLDVANVRRAFRVLLKQAKLPTIRLHDLRHSAGTLLLAQGVDVRTIMALLGHSQLSKTTRYVHVPAQLQEHAASRMDAVLGAAL